jgi:ABC-type dipeptide/oligopeptide/nickel transport system ATPase component
MGALIATQDVSLAEEVADYVAVLCDGEVVELGEARAVCTAPNHPHTQRLLEDGTAPEAPA